ncbi:MAG: Crp/Fnr family transcriptional regulator [Anaerolineae bacterium]|jgi:CRP/FNR family transcriptional regulator|nr:Crp/Fnr family transcriptional regulator [Anaerolineae bacterium]
MNTDYLRMIPYFEGISTDDFQYMSEQMTLQRFQAGEVLFLEGEPAQGLWIVETGRVKIFKLSAAGNEHILRFCGPGNTFNDIGALDRGDNPANAGALSESVEVWLVPSDAIHQVLLRNPSVALRVIQMLAKRVRTLVGQIEDLALYSVTVRLARFLLKQSNDPQLSGPGVTRTSIAAYLNTTPQTISVVLKELETLGAIRFNRHRIEIINEAQLRSIALL